MIHQVIQILHSILGLIFYIYCSYMTLLYFFMYSKCYDLIKQYIYHFSLSLFSLEDWVIVYEDQRIKCFTIFRIHKYSIHFFYYIFIEFNILLYLFLVISFAWYIECMIYLISLSKFWDVLFPFTFARVIGNLWIMWLGVNIFNPFPCLSFVGNIPLLKALRINSRLS